jgi:anamorsin
MLDDINLNLVLSLIQPNSKILFVWSGQSVPDSLKETIEQIKDKSKDSKISVEHIERLEFADYGNSVFDFIVSNLLTPKFTKHDSKVLYQYLKILKPKGVLTVFEVNENQIEKIESEYKLNGYLNLKLSKSSDIVSVVAEKPNFEVGSARKLKFSKPTETPKPTVEKKKIWQLNDDDIGESDLINTDDLLDEIDLKKPVLNSDKFDCGVADNKTGKRKACKNCVCGLAEELEKEVIGERVVQQQTSKSACGSCYLGDAFR